MQTYMSEAPVVEAQQDQQDDTLAQLQEGLQEHLQQQMNSSSYHSEAEHQQAAVDADVSTSAVQAAMETSVTGAAAPAEDSQGPATSAADDVVAAPARRAASVASGGSGEDEWHLVSPHGSVRMPCSSGRYSFEYAGGATPTIEVASSCGSDTTSTPKDALAESILGHPVMMAAAAADDTSMQTASALEMQHDHAGMELGDDDMDILRAASKLSSEGSLDGLHPAAFDESVDKTVGQMSEVSAEAAELQDSEDLLSGMGILSGEIATGLAGIKNWIMESLAALLQTGRNSHAACLSTAHTVQCSLHTAAKQGNLLAAAALGIADWRVALSSAAAVVCLAMYLKSRKENAALRTMLRRRDHELSKLVMRVVSLQELLNQGQALPITRYMRYESAGGASVANYM